MSTLQIIGTVASDEWRFLRRNKVAVFSMLVLMALVLISLLASYEHQRYVNIERAHYQSQVNHEFEAQPDRHPHRVAHFGHFLFRPLEPLAAFDAGIDTYTGHTLFLEAHRQNSANFGDIRQSSLLLRFGQLTPAFVLQILAPLLLIFVGHAVISRERQSGTLRLLFSQGIGGGTFLLGKLLALCGVAVLIFLPAGLALLWIMLDQQLAISLVAMLGAAYMAWLLIWVLVIVLISSLLAHSRDALLVLLAVWTVGVILLPRIVPDLVNRQLPLLTHFETNIAGERDLTALGDSHNPNDPYFAKFRQKVLAQYGVSRVEDLPVNYKGLLMAEGERMTTDLFNHYVQQARTQQQQQNAQVDRYGLLSPLLALRRLSMAATDSDLNRFNLFLQEGENYRYALVQRLNHIETEKISYADDMNEHKENRLDRHLWQQFPTFNFQASTAVQRIQHMVTPFGVLIIWLVLLVIFIKIAGIRLERSIK